MIVCPRISLSACDVSKLKNNGVFPYSLRPSAGTLIGGNVHIIDPLQVPPEQRCVGFLD